MDGEAVQATRARMMRLARSGSHAHPPLLSAVHSEAERKKRTPGRTEERENGANTEENPTRQLSQTEKVLLHNHDETVMGCEASRQKTEGKETSPAKALGQQGSNGKPVRANQREDGGKGEEDSAEELFPSCGNQVSGLASRHRILCCKPKDGTREELSDKDKKTEEEHARETLDNGVMMSGENDKRPHSQVSRQAFFCVLQGSFAYLPTSVGRAMRLWSGSRYPVPSARLALENVRGTVDG